MIDNDIKEMFYKKNREIIKNKLILDLDNNIDSLVATIENIIYLEFAIYKEKIFTIDVGNINKNKVAKILESYQKSINKIIAELIGIKKEKCSFFINELVMKDSIISYEDTLEKATDDIFSKFLSTMEKYVDEDIISNLIVDDWYLHNDKKINFYLNEKLGKDLFDKIILQLKDRDKIIYNNANESFKKYLALNDNIK